MTLGLIAIWTFVEEKLVSSNSRCTEYLFRIYGT